MATHTNLHFSATVPNPFSIVPKKKGAPAVGAPLDVHSVVRTWRWFSRQ
jgi:hypothetical protein